MTSSKLINNSIRALKKQNSKNFGERTEKACKVIKRNNIFIGGVCTSCIHDMPKEVRQIKYLTDVDLVHALNKVCDKNDKIKTYCNKCKQSLIVNKSNIGLFSSKDFERNL